MDICGSLMDIFDENPARSANKKTFMTKNTNIYDDEKAQNTRYIKKAVRITSNSLDK